jgi:hypothetical protein
MSGVERCGVCDNPLTMFGMRLAIVQGKRWHAWCWLTQMAPSAPGKRPVN